MFYTAVHAIDALLAHDHNSAVDHEGRNRALKSTNRYEFINTKYEPLYGLARTIRYLADPAKWVPADQIYKQVICRYLYRIERSVQKLIGQDLALGHNILKPPPGATARANTEPDRDVSPSVPQ